MRLHLYIWCLVLLSSCSEELPIGSANEIIGPYLEIRQELNSVQGDSRNSQNERDRIIGRLEAYIDSVKGNEITGLVCALSTSVSLNEGDGIDITHYSTARFLELGRADLAPKRNEANPNNYPHWYFTCDNKVDGESRRDYISRVRIAIHESHLTEEEAELLDGLNIGDLIAIDGKITSIDESFQSMVFENDNKTTSKTVRIRKY